MNLYYKEVECPSCGEIVTPPNIKVIKDNCGICPLCKKSADIEKYEEYINWINTDETYEDYED